MIGDNERIALEREARRLRASRDGFGLGCMDPFTQASGKRLDEIEEMLRPRPTLSLTEISE